MPPTPLPPKQRRQEQSTAPAPGAPAYDGSTRRESRAERVGTEASGKAHPPVADNEPRRSGSERKWRVNEPRFAKYPHEYYLGESKPAIIYPRTSATNPCTDRAMLGEESRGPCHNIYPEAQRAVSTNPIQFTPRPHLRFMIKSLAGTSCVLICEPLNYILELHSLLLCPSPHGPLR